MMRQTRRRGWALPMLGVRTIRARVRPRRGVVVAACAIALTLCVLAGRGHVTVLGANCESDVQGYSWGANEAGQVGDGVVAAARPTPFVLSGMSNVTAGDHHSLAVGRDCQGQFVVAWGANDHGQLGNGSPKGSTTPVKVLRPVDPTGHVVALAAGGGYSVAAIGDTDTDAVWAWGANDHGQLGNGSINSVPNPVPSRVEKLGVLLWTTPIAAGHDHALALMQDGTVRAWGANEHGQLGVGDTEDRSTPTPVLESPGHELRGVVRISAGNRHSLALLANGTVMAWGANDHGQLGDDNQDHEPHYRPVQVHNLTVAGGRVAAGGSHSLALTAPEGTVWAWGANDHGQLGDGTTTESHAPVQVRGVRNGTDIAAGENHSLVVNQSVGAWGANNLGQLGDGGTSESSIAVAVHGPSSDLRVTASGNHSLSGAWLRGGPTGVPPLVVPPRLPPSPVGAPPPRPLLVPPPAQQPPRSSVTSSPAIASSPGSSGAEPPTPSPLSPATTAPRPPGSGGPTTGSSVMIVLAAFALLAMGMVAAFVALRVRTRR
jgi:alpha-tubulin suppressor-like RCC1 family protein